MVHEENGKYYVKPMTAKQVLLENPDVVADIAAGKPEVCTTILWRIGRYDFHHDTDVRTLLEHGGRFTSEDVESLQGWHAYWSIKLVLEAGQALDGVTLSCLISINVNPSLRKLLYDAGIYPSLDDVRNCTFYREAHPEVKEFKELEDEILHWYIRGVYCRRVKESPHGKCT